MTDEFKKYYLEPFVDDVNHYIDNLFTEEENNAERLKGLVKSLKVKSLKKRK